MSKFLKDSLTDAELQEIGITREQESELMSYMDKLADTIIGLFVNRCLLKKEENSLDGFRNFLRRLEREKGIERVFTDFAEIRYMERTETK